MSILFKSHLIQKHIDHTNKLSLTFFTLSDLLRVTKHRSFSALVIRCKGFYNRSLMFAVKREEGILLRKSLTREFETLERFLRLLLLLNFLIIDSNV